MTGNIGRPGTGANSITGQCNAMGSRLFSNTTNLLGGRDFANAEHRREVAGILGIDAGANSRPAEPGLRPDPRGHSPTARSAACGSSPPTRPIPGSTRTPSARLSNSSISWSCRTCTTRRETAQLARPGAARRRLGRKGRHVHQLRAAHRPDQKGRPCAGPGAGRLCDLPADRRSLGLRRDVRRVDQPRSRVSAPEATLGAAGPATSPASPTIEHARRSRAASSGRCARIHEAEI